jgi:hypothetical protein
MATGPTKPPRKKPARGHVRGERAKTVPAKKKPAAAASATAAVVVAAHPGRHHVARHDGPLYKGDVEPEAMAAGLRACADNMEARSADYARVGYRPQDAATFRAQAQEIDLARKGTGGGDARQQPVVPIGAGAAIVRLHRAVKLVREQIHSYIEEALEDGTLARADAERLHSAMGLGLRLASRTFDGVLLPAKKLAEGLTGNAVIAAAADVTADLAAQVADGIAAVAAASGAKGAAIEGKTAASARLHAALLAGVRLLRRYRRKTNAAFAKEGEEPARVASLECIPRGRQHHSGHGRRKTDALPAPADPPAPPKA